MTEAVMSDVYTEKVKEMNKEGEYIFCYMGRTRSPLIAQYAKERGENAQSDEKGLLGLHDLGDAAAKEKIEHLCKKYYVRFLVNDLHDRNTQWLQSILFELENEGKIHINDYQVTDDIRAFTSEIRAAKQDVHHFLRRYMESIND